MHLRPALLAFSVLLVAFAPCKSAAAESADEAAARAAIAQRSEALQSLRVEYDIEEENYPQPSPPLFDALPQAPPPAGGGVLAFSASTGVERSTGRFSFLKGMVRYEHRASAPRSLTQTFRPDAFEQLAIFPNQISAAIRPPEQQPRTTTIHIDLGLGLRDSGLLGQRGWLNTDTLREMSFARDTDGRIVLTRAEPRDYRSEFVFDPKIQHALVAYRLRTKNPGPAVVEVTARDFKPISGVQIPHVITRQNYNLDLKRPTSRWQATITRCDVNDPANNQGHYYIAWPKGIELVDARPHQLRHRKIQQEGQKIKD